jgi:hypothetical protein
MPLLYDPWASQVWTEFPAQPEDLDMTVSAPLYPRVMGNSWSELAEPLRSMHTTTSPVRARGHLRIEYGLHPIARLLARLLRLPHPSASADTRLVVSARSDGEHWERTFDGRRFATLQCRWHDDLAERFGVSRDSPTRCSAQVACHGSRLRAERGAPSRATRGLRSGSTILPEVVLRIMDAKPLTTDRRAGT